MNWGIMRGRGHQAVSVFSDFTAISLPKGGLEKFNKFLEGRKMRKLVVLMAFVALYSFNGVVHADLPVVPPGYFVEAYVTGLQNVNAIAFSPGGSFGYAGQLFVGDSRPNPGTIYRVPNKGNKIFFASAASSEPRSLEFAPLGSSFGSFLYCSDAYTIQKYDSSGARSWFANIHAFGWDLAFAPDGRFRNNLFHADGWEPAGEAVREWIPDGSQAPPVYTEREETSGLAFGPGGAFGEDLYIAFVYSQRSGYPYSAIGRVTPEGVLTEWLVSEQFGYTNQLAFDTGGHFRGNLFLSDYKHDVIWEIEPNGNISLFASQFLFSQTPYHNT